MFRALSLSVPKSTATSDHYGDRHSSAAVRSFVEGPGLELSNSGTTLQWAAEAKPYLNRPAS